MRQFACKGTDFFCYYTTIRKLSVENIGQLSIFSVKTP